MTQTMKTNYYPQHFLWKFQNVGMPWECMSERHHRLSESFGRHFSFSFHFLEKPSERYRRVMVGNVKFLFLLSLIEQVAYSCGLILSPTPKEGLFSDYQVSNFSKLLSMNLYLFSSFLGQDHFFMLLFLICTEEERSGCRNRFAFNEATSEVQLFGGVDVLAHLSCRRSSNSPARNTFLFSLPSSASAPS